MSLQNKNSRFDVKNGLTLSLQELFSVLLNYRKDLLFLNLQNSVTSDPAKNIKFEANVLKKNIAKVLTCINDKNRKKK